MTQTEASMDNLIVTVFHRSLLKFHKVMCAPRIVLDNLSTQQFGTAMQGIVVTCGKIGDRSVKVAFTISKQPHRQANDHLHQCKG